MWDIFKPPKINKQTRHLNKTKEITKKTINYNYILFVLGRFRDEDPQLSQMSYRDTLYRLNSYSEKLESLTGVLSDTKPRVHHKMLIFSGQYLEKYPLYLCFFQVRHGFYNTEFPTDRKKTKLTVPTIPWNTHYTVTNCWGHLISILYDPQ